MIFENPSEGKNFKLSEILAESYNSNLNWEDKRLS